MLLVFGGHVLLAGAPATLPHAPKPTHDQRIVAFRLGPVDELIEKLVVAGGGQLDPLTDRYLLGPGLGPP